MSGTGTVTKWSTGVSGPQHLQSLVQKGDTIIQSVKLEGTHLERNRYLAVVQNSGLDNYCLLGLDEVQQDPGGLSVGLVAKLLWDAQISLDGDGGFSVRQLGRHLIFKPVSVQALWTVIQTLHMISERLSPSPPKSLESPSLDEDVTAALPWPECAYLVQSPQSCINEWHFMADLLVRRPPSPDRAAGPDGTQDSETIIKTKLRQIMKTVDLDSITSKSIRKQLEGEMEKDLEEFKSFIDKEILLILGQMDPASMILDYLYLGSEWNASNLDELRANGITHILNVTREIDNFFPAVFTYNNIREYDEEATDLLKYLDRTYKFIRMAKEAGGKVLVHCKMGISRSATVTISFIMKEYDLGLAETLIMVKEKRNIINPNKSFIKQLEVYEGILGAIRHRRNYVGLFRSKSESSLIPTSPCSQLEDRSPPPSTPTYRRGITESINIDIKALATVFDQSAAARPNSEPIFCGRPKSWSPNDKVAGFLLDRKQRQDQKETGKDEEEFEDDDCRCFGEQLSQNYSTSPSSSSPCLSSKVRRLSSALTSSSAATPGEASIIEARNSSLISSAPVNSKTVTLYNPNCPCDIELELGVPEDPVVLEEKTPDVRTDSVVHNLSNLSLQMRTNSQHLVDGLQTSPSLAGPQLQQQKSAQLLLRQSSLDRQFLDGKPSTTSTHDSDNKLILNEISSSRRGRKEDELSVKTLANMFDFKNCSVPMRPCSARLEDSHLFQKAAKNLAATTTTPANKTRNSNESETTQSDC